MVIPEHRQKEEIEAWKERDPILRFERYLRENGILDGPGQAALKQQVQEEIEQAATFAREASLPEPETVYDGLWA
jgi:TPP-dependent pyruvate/acetoin dehydrogenase alpha subunit